MNNDVLYSADIRTKKRKGFIRFTLSEDSLMQDPDCRFLRIFFKGLNSLNKAQTLMIEVANCDSDIFNSPDIAAKDAEMGIVVKNKRGKTLKSFSIGKNETFEALEKILEGIEPYLPPSAQVSILKANAENKLSDLKTPAFPEKDACVLMTHGHCPLDPSLRVTTKVPETLQ